MESLVDKMRDYMFKQNLLYNKISNLIELEKMKERELENIIEKIFKESGEQDNYFRRSSNGWYDYIVDGKVRYSVTDSVLKEIDKAMKEGYERDRSGEL